MKVIIRQEISADHENVFHLVKKAFRTAAHSDHQEHFLVERLRNSAAFIPELSLIADFENRIVGHILLTEIQIINKDKSFQSLALAPVSVLPEFQGKGIGGKLIESAHQKAKELNYKSIVLLGDPNYYRRFGYESAGKYHISLPFEGVEEYSMAIELAANGLKGAAGTVRYAKEFYDGEN